MATWDESKHPRNPLGRFMSKLTDVDPSLLGGEDGQNEFVERYEGNTYQDEGGTIRVKSGPFGGVNVEVMAKHEELSEYWGGNVTDHMGVDERQTLHDYRTHSYAMINSQLRDAEGDLDAIEPFDEDTYIEDDVEVLDDAMNYLGTPRELTVHRGIHVGGERLTDDGLVDPLHSLVDRFDRVENGEEEFEPFDFVDDGFISTSLDPEVTDRFRRGVTDEEAEDADDLNALMIEEVEEILSSNQEYEEDELRGVLDHFFDEDGGDVGVMDHSELVELLRIKNDEAAAALGEPGVRFDVKVPKGTPSFYMESLDRERQAVPWTQFELVLPRSSTFKITGQRRDGNVRVFDAEWYDAP